MSDTERLDPRYTDIDLWPTADAVSAMLEGQMAAVAAVRPAVAALADAADAAAERLLAGGRLVYAGAGTSGRIAVQDGVELGPTFGWPNARTIFLLAGGMAALARSAEGAEDDLAAAGAEVVRAGVAAGDVVIGVAASGRTPFTIAVIAAARARDALTIGIANNPGTPLLSAPHHALLADTGSEAVAGSTRMKAGTAQKVMLNLLSTAIMLRMGRVYRGYMVDMVISNDKLMRRAERMVATLGDCGPDGAAAALAAGGNDIATAILIARGAEPAEAADRLARSGGMLRRAIDAGG